MKNSKKVLILLSALIVLCGLVICCLFVINREQTDMGFAEKGETVFVYNTTNRRETLSDEDFDRIIGIFEGKKLYRDDPSCGFTADIAVKFNGAENFCIARDTCPIVYVESKDKYFKLSEKEYSELVGILSKYGFSFPCV